MSLNTEKSIAFRNVCLAQILFILYAIILESKLSEPFKSIFFFLVINIFTISSYLMLRKLTSSKRIRLFTIFLIILADSIGIILSVIVPLGFELTN